MRISRCGMCLFTVIVALCLLQLPALKGDAAGEEAKQAPPFASKLTGKKFSHTSYESVLFGKIVLFSDEKPLESRDKVWLHLSRKGNKEAKVWIECHNGEYFTIQATPGEYTIERIFSKGRSYRIERDFRGACKDSLVYMGTIGIRMAEETPAYYGYIFSIDNNDLNGNAGSHNAEMRDVMNSSVPSDFLQRHENHIARADFFTSDPNQKPNSGRYKNDKNLLKASRSGDLSTVSELLALGHDPDMQDDYQRTPLMHALWNNNSEIAALLLHKGASISVKDKNHWTPLMYALRDDEKEIARQIIEKGADINARNNEGWTPLMFALRYNQPDNAILLINKGAAINAKDDDNWTPLMYALRYSKSSEVSYRLIEDGAEVNAKNKNGWTPLLIALDNYWFLVARFLIERGADVTARTNRGETALSIAGKRGYTALAGLLSETAGSLCEKLFYEPLSAGVLAPPIAIMKTVKDPGDLNKKTAWSSADEVLSFQSATHLEAESLVCIREDRVLAGYYSNRQGAYRLNWEVSVIKLPDQKVLARKEFRGGPPPEYIKDRESGYGYPPVFEARDWLLSIIDIGQWKLLRHPCKDYVNTVVFSPDGKKLLSLSEYAVSLLDAAKAKTEKTLTKEYSRFLQNGVVFTPQGKALAASYNYSKKTMVIWDVAAGDPVQTFSEQESHEAVFSPDGRILAYSHGDTIKLRDIFTGKLIRTLTDPQENIELIAFAPDGRIIASVSRNHVRLWNAASGKLEKIFPHKGYAEEVFFTPDRKYLAVVSNEKIALWNLSTGKVGKEFPNGLSCRPALSPDGKSLATCADTTIYLSDIMTGRSIRSLKGHTGGNITLTFSPDGKTLASGGGMFVKLWDL